MKGKMMLYQTYQLTRNKFLLFLLILLSNFQTQAQKQDCGANRQFYTKFLSSVILDDTSVFVTENLFNKTPGLYSMSSTDKNGNELDCTISAFSFTLMSADSILYKSNFDTVTFSTLDTIRQNIKQYNIKQGDILLFTNIKVKHYCNSCKKYCYHDGLPMLKVIDNFKNYPRRMYMNVSKKHQQKGK